MRILVLKLKGFGKLYKDITDHSVLTLVLAGSAPSNCLKKFEILSELEIIDKCYQNIL